MAKAGAAWLVELAFFAPLPIPFASALAVAGGPASAHLPELEKADQKLQVAKAVAAWLVELVFVAHRPIPFASALTVLVGPVSARLSELEKADQTLLERSKRVLIGSRPMDD